jgi:hypothetical protein
VENLEGKKRLGRPRGMSTRDDNITMELKEIGCCGMDWISLTEDIDQRGTAVKNVTSIRVP